MERLRAKDLQGLLDCLAACYALGDLDSFAKRIPGALRALVPADHAAYNEVNPVQRHISYVMDPPEADLPGGSDIFSQFVHQHPLINYYAQTGDGSAHKISDFLTGRQFHDLGLYQEFYSHFPVEYQVAFELPAPVPLVVGNTLSRTNLDFSERERLLLNLARPHLLQAYRNADLLTLMRSGLEAERTGVVEVDRGGRILWLSARARQLLDGYFNEIATRAGGLPEALRAYLWRSLRCLSADSELLLAIEPLVVEREGRRLTVRCVPATQTGQQHLLLLREERRDIDPAALAPLGLSRRESEVLRLVAVGETDAQIARELGLSPRTVHKHLERIYRKLNVENRTAASELAWRAAYRSE